MSGETGTGQDYRSEMHVSEAAWHPLGRLEDVLDRCSPGTVAHASHDDGHYVAFRRRGCAYAVRLGNLPEFVAVDPDKKGEHRKEMDAIIAKIGEGMHEHTIVRGSNTRNTCLGHAGFDPKIHPSVEYALPEGASLVRRMGRRIMFYSEMPPEAARKDEKPMPARRRNYFRVPEGATKMRCSGSDYEWLMPEGDSSAWVKMTKKAG